MSTSTSGRWRPWVTVAVLLAVVAAAIEAWPLVERHLRAGTVTLTAADPGWGRGGLPGGTGDGGRFSFRIRAASVDGLYPGAIQRLRLRVTNPYSVALEIVTVAGTVLSTSEPSCAVDPRNLVVQQYQGPPALPLVIAAGRPAELGAIAVVMPDTVQDACQRTSFEIGFFGTARRITR